MKKRVMNIRPQEVTVDGERSVQYWRLCAITGH